MVTPKGGYESKRQCNCTPKIGSPKTSTMDTQESLLDWIMPSDQTSSIGMLSDYCTPYLFFRHIRFQNRLAYHPQRILGHRRVGITPSSLLNLLYLPKVDERPYTFCQLSKLSM